MKMNPLIDNDFLTKLTSEHEREIYAKIISLDLDENPIEEITGNVTQGSISIDGASAIRRTCSISMAASELNINDYYWGLNTKIRVFVGMKNFIDKRYPDIIWFPQGIFILTSFNTSQSTTGWSISLQGKDKMCLLNGDVGGSITALSVDFGKLTKIEKDDNGNMISVKEDLLLEEIIREAVHEYAKEPYYNIIINDLNDVGLELLEYRGDVALYLLVNQQSNEVTNYTIDENQTYYQKETEYIYGTIKIKDIPVYDNRITLDFGNNSNNPSIIYSFIEGEGYIPYSVIKVTKGEVIGYRITNLTYAGDLIATVGNSITSAVLDKIVQQFGNFEYFYDVDGRFIFQKKKTYVDTTFNSLVKNEESETYAENAMLTSQVVYSFEDSHLITAFQNNPTLNNVKNDYAVWGKRKSIASGTEIPIHYRYAIDKKPIRYTSYDGITYTTLGEEAASDKIQELEKEYEELMNKFNSYEKNPNPNGLPEDWWEVQDWANYYNTLMGHYPFGYIGQYANEGKGGTNVPITDLEKYFQPPKNDSPYYRNYPVYIFDIVYDIENGDIGNACIGYSGHATSCGHSYDYFLDRVRKGIGTSYIYKPVLPEEDYKQRYDEIIGEEKTSQLIGALVCNCDWRELIYQMASDYSKHRYKEDFITQIENNNNGLYLGGITGYEQYYTDILSFWRDLYDPTLKEAKSKVYTKIDNNDYVKANWNAYVTNGVLYVGALDNYNYTYITNNSIFEKDTEYFIREQKANHSYFTYTPIDSESVKDQWNDLISNRKLYSGVQVSNKYLKVTNDFAFMEDSFYYLEGDDSGYLHNYPENIYSYQLVDEVNNLYAYKKLNYTEFLDRYPVNEFLTKDIIDANEKIYYKYGIDVQTIYSLCSTSLLQQYSTDNEYYIKNEYSTSDEDMFLQVNKIDDIYKFDVDETYYEYQGYKSVIHFDKGKKYYSRAGTSVTGYTYEYAFEFKENVEYTIATGEIVNQFITGNTYYSSEGSITIYPKNYFELPGINGYVPIYNAILPHGYYYYNDEDGNKIFLDENYITVGKNLSYFVPREYTDAQIENLEEVNGYTNINGEFEYGTFLFNFILSKKYYNKDTHELLRTVYWKDKYKNTIWYVDNTYAPNYWVIDVNNPSVLNFWFDFLDTEGELSKYNVSKIGIRPKAENNDKVTAIYYRETPTVIFVNPDDDLTEQKKQKPGYTFVRCPDYIEELFTISSQQKSAKDQIDNLLYQHTYCTETITLTTLPIYYLQPNTRIFVNDIKSGINGEYIVTKLTIPLAYNGTMSITATKAVENMY